MILAGVTQLTVYYRIQASASGHFGPLSAIDNSLHTSSALGTLEWEFIWKQGICRCDQVKMRPYRMRVGSKVKDKCLYKRNERKIQTQRHRGVTQERRPREDEAEIRIIQLQTKGYQGFPGAIRKKRKKGEERKHSPLGSWSQEGTWSC